MKKVGTYTLVVAFFAAIGSFLFGYDTGITITTIGQPTWTAYMSNPKPSIVGLVASMYNAGTALGMLFQVAVADRLGRIRYMQLLCVGVLVGSVVQTAAQGIGMFVGGRAVSGFFVGGLLLTSPMYLSEISPPSHRGFIGGFSGIGLSFGLMMANWTGYASSFAPYGNIQWRLPIGLQIPWPIIMLFGLCTFMPDSPRHLIRRSRIEEARQIFKRIYGGLEPEETRREFRLMQGQIEFETKREIESYAEIFRVFRRRALVAISTGVMTVLNGAQVVANYQTILYKALGLSDKTILLLIAALGMICLISVSLSACFLLEQWGRRNVLLAGLGLLIPLQIYCAVMQREFQHSDNEVGKGFAVLGIFLYNIVQAGAFEGATLLFQAEVLPLSIRSKVMALCGFSNFTIQVGLLEAAPSAFATIGENYYYVFVGCTIVFFILGYLYFPETSHRPLEEVAAEFGDQVVEVRGSDEDLGRSDGMQKVEEAVKVEKKV